MSNQPILVLSDITKTYRQGGTSIKILNEVNLSVNPGELIAIIGASGSGKSTLLHIAGLLDQPDSGFVQIGWGNNVKDLKTDMIRLKYVGFVYQYHHLLNHFTARENVALPKIISGCDREEAFSRADQLLEQLGLRKKKYNMPGELSGGEQQRVAIARSLINNPKIILADEPTGNLDHNTGDEVFNLFVELAKQQGTAIIMVTHNNIMAEKMYKICELVEGSLK